MRSPLGLVSRDGAFTVQAASPTASVPSLAVTDAGLWAAADYHRGADGYPQVGGGAFVTANDWAKVGEFVRLGGKHNGKQIVNSALLAQCFQGTKQNPAYGLTWWLKKPVSAEIARRIPLLSREWGEVANSAALPNDLVAACGAGKQRLYVVPSLKLVIARQGRLSQVFDDMAFLNRLFGNAPAAAKTRSQVDCTKLRQVLPFRNRCGYNPLMQRREFLKRTGQTAMAATILGGSAALSAQPQAAAEQGDTGAQTSLLYPLRDGYVQNWLVAGPLNVPVEPGEYKFQPDLRPAILEKYFREGMYVPTAKPIEGAAFTVEDKPLAWRYVACDDDHLIDLSLWHPKSDYVRVWASCVLDSPDGTRETSFRLSTNGPALVWLNGKLVFQHREFDYFGIVSQDFKATLQKGGNTILVRFDQIITRNGPHTMAMRLLGDAMSVRVKIPTRTADVERRQALETAFDKAYASRDTYGDGQEIRLIVPPLVADATNGVAVELLSGQKIVRTAISGPASGSEAAFVSLGTPDKLSEGTYAVRLRDAAGEVVRDIRVDVARDAFSPQPYGTYQERRREALEYAAKHAKGLRRELAKMELGRFDEVDNNGIDEALDAVREWKDGGDGEVMGLMGMLIRHSKKISPATHEAVKKAVLAFRYWTDEPGRTAMTYGSENHQLTFQTAEILAGQMYPDAIFTNNGKNGAWHRAHGEKLAGEWLEKRLAYGFDEWDANGYLAADLAILSHLTLAENARLRDGATQIMHKILFGIAVNSWKGSYGVAHARTQGDYIKDARREPVACVARLIWGVGTWNQAIGSATAVAASTYRPAPIIEAIALDLPGEMWARQRQGLPPETERVMIFPADSAIYKTPDFQLASVQNYRAGQPGDNMQQHIWQATLGVEANVWVNHPACISENGNRRPNFWMGNGTFPRVAQWKDTLIGMYRFRPTDWLDFTHAYFPTFAFDEHLVENGWAFARVGNGYLALRAAGNLTMVTRGKSALRELRSPGRENVWLCQMGRKAQDGDFAAFRKKVRALPAKFDGLSTTFINLRGESLSFGWDAPLKVNGVEQPINNFPQFDNPYCKATWPAEQIKIQHAGQELTLKIAVQV